MSKFVLALLAGVFFTFILDFFLFLSFKLHYIDLYEIDVYYNILFADNQNIFIYLMLTFILGYLVIYFEDMKIVASILGLLFLTVLTLNFIPSLGQYVAKSVLMKKGQRIFDGKHIYKGDIYYNDRDKIYMYDIEIQKLITINKKDIKE
ncbi:MAG: hypothetical protein U9P71_02180 [Campylobacterota bacterium]|nr:hypothetical protein [Campylobacterota bacterium]